MKKILLPFLIIAVVIATACNNAKDNNVTSGILGDSTTSESTKADSLMQLVMDGHNEGMAKYGKIRSMQAELTRLLDSIAKLPAKAKEAIAPLRTGLERALNDINNAKNHMDVWMDSFNMDSAANDLKVRIQYLTEEKLKVGEVKEAILSSLSKADSVLKTKF